MIRRRHAGTKMNAGAGRLICAALAVAAIALAWSGGVASGGGGSALGGPVIIGGDDLTEHGGVDASGNPIQGWLYLQRALENVRPQVTRPNDGSVAALGSGDPGPTPINGNAGSAIQVAAARAGLPVAFFNGDAAITQFFANIQAGTARPAIVWIAGNGATNDLVDGPGDEAGVLTANAAAIASFVGSGGGLVSHGSEFRWLTALLPGLTNVSSGSSGDLQLTPEGQAAFPGVTDADLNAGPWHNHFEGDFGGLRPLVLSTTVKDAAGNPAVVVLGGSKVTILPPPPPPPALAAPALPLAPVKAPIPASNTLLYNPATGQFFIRVQYRIRERALKRLCAAGCPGSAEIRTRKGRRLFVRLPGDGRVILGKKRGFTLRTARRVRIDIPISKAALSGADFRTVGGFRVAETRMRITVTTALGGALTVRDGNIRVSIARIQSGALPGLKGILAL